MILRNKNRILHNFPANKHTPSLTVFALICAYDVEKVLPAGFLDFKEDQQIFAKFGFCPFYGLRGQRKARMLKIDKNS